MLPSTTTLCEPTLRSNESYGALRRISAMLQKFGWACKCDECRQFGTNNCGNNDILYIGLTRDPNACCVEAYDGTPTDGVTAHGFFCFHALLLMQQNARDNDECDIMCVCKKTIDAWLPMRRGIMHEDDLTPGTPWSEGDVAPVPLTQEQLQAEYPRLWQIHCRPDWKNKQEFPWQPYFPTARNLCSVPLREWAVRKEREIKTEDPAPHQTGGEWMAAAGSSNDRQGGAPKPRLNQWVHIAFTHNVFQDRALRQGTTLNLDYVPAVEVFTLTSVVGAYKRSLTELHKGPTIDYGEPVAVNPWRRSQVVPLTMRVPYRNEEMGFAFTQSKLVCAQKVVDDILSRIQTHDRLLNSWILYWATELRFLIEALRLKNDSLRDIIDNPVRITWIRRITFMLMMTFGGTTDALLDRCKSSIYDDREWKLAMAIPYFPRAADRVPESTTQLIKRPEDRHSDVKPVLSRCHRMIPWSPNSGRRLDTARHWTSGNDLQHIVHMHSFEQKWSYKEFEGVPKMVAEVDATNLDSTDVAMDTLQMSPSTSAARTQRRASALTTEMQSDECDSIKWGQTYPAGYKKPSGDLRNRMHE